MSRGINGRKELLCHEMICWNRALCERLSHYIPEFIIFASRNGLPTEEVRIIIQTGTWDTTISGVHAYDVVVGLVSSRCFACFCHRLFVVNFNETSEPHSDEPIYETFVTFWGILCL
jgi:hypothetical protein